MKETTGKGEILVSTPWHAVAKWNICWGMWIGRDKVSRRVLELRIVPNVAPSLHGSPLIEPLGLRFLLSQAARKTLRHEMKRLRHQTWITNMCFISWRRRTACLYRWKWLKRSILSGKKNTHTHIINDEHEIRKYQQKKEKKKISWDKEQNLTVLKLLYHTSETTNY